MAYEMVMPYHLHMPSYFLETFTEYPYTMPRSMFMHVCLHEATHMYVRVCAYVCECESYKSPKYKDVFKKDQELFK